MAKHHKALSETPWWERINWLAATPSGYSTYSSREEEGRERAERQREEQEERRAAAQMMKPTGESKSYDNAMRMIGELDEALKKRMRR
jgi:hypothetical protein